MSEEKKPTETEIIREQVAKAQEWCEMAVLDNEVRDRPALNALASMLSTIHEANEARDKSRRLDVAFALPITETTARGLLAIGFDVALAAVIPQLKTVRKSGNCTAWTPPLNPFSAGGSASAEGGSNG